MEDTTVSENTAAMNDKTPQGGVSEDVITPPQQTPVQESDSAAPDIPHHSRHGLLVVVVILLFLGVVLVGLWVKSRKEPEPSPSVMTSPSPVASASATPVASSVVPSPTPSPSPTDETIELEEGLESLEELLLGIDEEMSEAENALTESDEAPFL